MGWGSPRAKRAGLLVLGAVLVACGAWALQAASGRAVPPRDGLRDAEQAYAEARDAGAAKLAGDEWQRAESAMREARLEFRRQELRFYLLRDFGKARGALQTAALAAARAGDTSRSIHQTQREAAGAALARARCEVSRTENLARAYRFAEPVAAAARVAGSRLAEAEASWERVDLEEALSRAERARAEAKTARARMREELARFVDPDNLKHWNDERRRTVRLSATRSQPAMVVNKDEGTLVLYESGKAARTYDVELGLNAMARKLRSGDAATPEGTYQVTAKRAQGATKYYKALDLNYPNKDDLQRLERHKAQHGLPSRTHPGAWIEIHGEGGRGRDWTNGCIALDNKAMDDLFRRVPVGTPVTIVGGDGDGGRFSKLEKFLASSGVERECGP